MRQEIEEFIGDCNQEHRYASWDYCFSYFRGADGHLTDDMEKSCTILGFYLASWGMLRGSSPLLKKSSRYYWKLIEFVNQVDSDNPSFSSIDVPDYVDSDIRKVILDRYRQVEKLLDGDSHESSLTRTTKVMLGIWGNVPAFDRNFRATLKYDLGASGYMRMTHRALRDVYNRFELVPEEKKYLQSFDYRVLNFYGEPTKLRYPIAKLIDMYGFIRGAELLRDN